MKKVPYRRFFLFCFSELGKIDGLYFIDAANKGATNFQRIHCNIRLSFNIYREKETESEMYMNTCADSGLGIVHYDHQTVMYET